jgi:DNA-binding MarR family transcriptional regulator
LASRRKVASAALDIERGRAETLLETSFALGETTRLLRSAFDQRMRAIGLTGAAWRLITQLSREDGQTQASLARRLEITAVALGEAVDRLEKSGHVERRADPNDRRKWRVYLTPLSERLLPDMFAKGEDMQSEAFRDLSDADVARFHAMLARVRGRLHEMRVETADDDPA